jgi:hypothetical protein
LLSKVTIAGDEKMEGKKRRDLRLL